MKKLLSYSSLPLLSFFSVIVLMTSCQTNSKHSNNNQKIDSREKSYNDFEAAMLYEFNMTKNPYTGKIPVGIREAELAQAEFNLRNQPQNRIEALSTYTFQGPNNLGGRTRTIVYDIRYDGGANTTIFAGGVSGGVFKSLDNGTTWVRKSPIGDLFNVTSIAQDTRVGFRDTWYYAGGEVLGNSTSGGAGSSYRGHGVYKSTDNGETWARLTASNTGALESFDHRADYVWKVVVDPTTGYVYIAALDAIYRSIDGGTTWGFALTSTSGSYGTGMSTDIVVTSTGRFYAAFSGGCNTSPTNMPGVWTSLTGASASWTKIAGPTSGTTPAGWNAAGAFGRCVLAYAPSLESKVFALYSVIVGACTKEAELFEWADGSSTWTEWTANLPDEAMCLAGNDPFAVQGGYDLVVAVKPDDPTVVFAGGTNIYRSTTGFSTAGATTRIGGYASAASYALYASSHPDIHSIVFSPISSTTMLCGNDGGIQRTTANLATPVVWSQINTGYRTYQYYYVTVDPRVANTKVLGGAQDNGSTRNIGGAGSDFESMMGGDGVSVGLSDLISGTQYEYVGFQSGTIIRRASTLSSGFGTVITPSTVTSSLFVTLFKLDQDNTTERLYYAGANKLYRTATASTTSTAVTGPPDWAELTGVSTAVGVGPAISALATSRGAYSASSSLFIGISDGRLYRLDDPTGVAAATAPVLISPGGGFPGAVGAWLSSIAVNPRNHDTVMVTFANYAVISVFWTGTAKSATPTWTAVEGTGVGKLDLPSFRSSAIAITSSGVNYYVGTSVGLYNAVGLPATPATISWALDGASDMGFAPVTSLSLRTSDNKLLSGTHGYGMWFTILPLPLPVTLTEFKGTLQNKNALLQWTTASETNSKHFELEKSFDGINYRKIVTIAAAGNSNSPRQYSYTDREPLTEKNYYRLKSVDIDNVSKLSNIVLLKLAAAKQDIVVLGNPFTNNILVRFVRSPDSKGELRLTDMAGRLMARQSFGQGEQQIQFIMPAGKLAAGAYLLQAVIGNEKFITRVLKE